MASNNETQRMFQLELQVGGVTWGPHTAIEPAATVCVSFQFLSYPPLEICQQEFCADCTHNDVTFKSGKMMIFALQRSDLVRLHNNFNIHIRVTRVEMKADRFPFRTEMASAEVNISDDFSAILSSCFQPQTQHPAHKFINDEIDLVDGSGTVVGVMNLFLRLSTHGMTSMGRLYAPDSSTGAIKVEPDWAAQALVTQTQVGACAKRYAHLKSAFIKEPVYREYRATSEDGNMIAVRLYKLDAETKPPKVGGTSTTGSQTIEPGTLVLRGNEMEYYPDPRFSKPDDASSVYYRVTSNDEPPEKLMLQHIPTATEEPRTSLGPITGLPPDDKVDTYVLRVGKKKAGYKLRSHLLVEVRTPKFVSRRKERFYATTQYDGKDLVPPPPVK